MQLLAGCTLVLLSSIRCLYCSKLEVEEFGFNYNEKVLKCLDSLMSIANWPVHNFLLIYDDTENMDNDFLQRHSNFAWELCSEGNHNFTGFYNVILIADDFQNLNETLSAMSVQPVDSRAKFVIIVRKNYASLEEIKLASEGISEIMWMLDKTRVVYLVPCSEVIFAMTYYPFAKNCQVGDLELLDVWREKDFEKGIKLFPEKMLDIRGCNQSATFIFDEFVEFQLRKELTETGEVIVGGVAGRLITIVAERMNMMLHIVTEETDSWEILVDKILRGESLFSIAGNIPTADRTKILDMDSSFMQESFAFGYNPGGFEVSWTNLVLPLTKETWAYIGCTFLLFFGLILLINCPASWKIGSDKFTIFDSFGIFLGSSRALPRGYFGRYVLGMWIVYSYLINAFYNSGFVSFLTTPHEKRVINTFEDLLAAGIDFGDNEFVRELYNDPSDPVMMEVYENCKIWSDEEASHMVKIKQGATGVFSSSIYKYNSDHVGEDNNQIRMLKQNAFTFHAPIFMRRGSPFAVGVHHYTVQIIESGFFEYWMRYYTRTPPSPGISTEATSGISMRHLRGIFYFYVIAIICSSLVFLFEYVSYKWLSDCVTERKNLSIAKFCINCFE